MVLTILLATVITGLFIISKLHLQTELVIKYFDHSRQLYWLFNNHIRENNGLSDDYVFKNNQNDVLEDLLINKLNKLNKLKKVELLTLDEFSEQFKLSKYLINLIDRNSAIVKINYLIINNSIEIQNQQKIFYIAHKFVGSTVRTGLYVYENNYSDELVPDVASMTVHIESKKNINYYFFDFLFDSSFNSLLNSVLDPVSKELLSTISFVITDIHEN